MGNFKNNLIIFSMEDAEMQKPMAEENDPMMEGEKPAEEEEDVSIARE